ncbi:AN1-type zinc finger protein 2B [Halotydeus destructor]|nr:AN1-type zinc finger protein 2B [Halotydeus destructor]
MEFPDLGQHCSITTCNRLDFLPIRCDSCSKTYCSDHYSYTSHTCPNAHTKDFQVPVCPLCSQPVAMKRGELPDIRVSAHIDDDCQDVRAKQKRKNSVFSSKCTKKGCKSREMVKILCTVCDKNFCLKHRHSMDHDCVPVAKQSTKSINEIRNSMFSWVTGGPKAAEPKTNMSKSKSINGVISEDEALARALQESLVTESAMSRSQSNLATGVDEEDRQLAAAIAASQRDQRSKERCVMS